MEQKEEKNEKNFIDDNGSSNDGSSIDRLRK